MALGPAEMRDEPLFLTSSTVQPAAAPRFTRGISRRRIGLLNPVAARALQSSAPEIAVTLDLRPGGLQRLQTDATGRTDRGVHWISGTLEGSPTSQFFLADAGGELVGSFSLPGTGAYRVRSSGTTYELLDLNVVEPPACGTVKSPPLEPESSAVAKFGWQPVSLGSSANGEEPRQIEVMVVYTRQAKEAAGGSAAIEVLIQIGLLEANSAFQSSRSGVELHLVHAVELNFPESGDLNLDLARLRAPGDGYLDDVHAVRDTVGADLVCLVVESSNRYEGIASFPEGPESGFCVVDRFHLTGYGIVAHEFGHNFGCDHDRENRAGGGRFGYSFGHRLDVDGETYRTLMCYSPGWPIGYFSNPEVNFRGSPTGVPAGERDEADNARTIREMALFVDSYRGLNVSLTEPSAPLSLPFGASVELAAVATSSEGPIQGVEFFDNGSLVGQAEQEPFRTVWSPTKAGRHLLTARVTTSGMQATSTAVTVGLRPENDDFARRPLLTDSNIVLTASLSEATVEAGEPLTFEESGGTAWWTWRSPAAGTVRVAAASPGVKPRVAVYQGSDLADLRLVAKFGPPAGDTLFETAAGQDYQISLQAGGEDRPVTLYVTMEDPPANDNFANALPVAQSTAALIANTVGATREKGETAIALSTFGHTVWYAWAPPATGQAKISLGPSQTGVTGALAVFEGSDLPSLRIVATPAELSQGILVSAGKRYWIQVDGPYGEFPLNVSLVGTPKNDNFAQRIALTSMAGYLTFSSAGATREPGEPVHGNAPGGRSQWWSWRAAADGGLRMTLMAPIASDNPIPISVAVYWGNSVTNLTLVAAHDFENRFQESWVLPVLRGTNYQIAVDGVPLSSSSPGLRMEFRQRASNDAFRARVSGVVIPTQFSGTTMGATSEPGEPDHAGLPARHSVWWSWSFRTNGLMAALVSSSGSVLPRLAVYSGTVLTNLALVADNRVPDGLSGTLVFPVASGTNYQIVVDEEVSAFSCTVRLQPVVAPTNDFFARRMVLPGTPQMMVSSTIGATSEPGEPDHVGLGKPPQSVWFTWTPRTSTRVSLLAGASAGVGSVASEGMAVSPEPYVSIYTGTSLAELTPVSGGTGSATWNAERNIAYQIAIDCSQSGPQQLVLSTVVVPNNDQFERASVMLDSTSLILLNPSQLRAATRQPEEPVHRGVGSGHSLWWTWTPRRSGIYILSDRKTSYLPYGNGIRPVETIYRGTNLANLTSVASNSRGTVQFAAEAGIRYYLAIDLDEPSIPLQFSMSGSLSVDLYRQPMVLNAATAPADNIQFAVVGAPGQRLSLETSADLVQWVPIRTVQVSSVEFKFRELRGSEAKFYRVIPLTSP